MNYVQTTATGLLLGTLIAAGCGRRATTSDLLSAATPPAPRVAGVRSANPRAQAPAEQMLSFYNTIRAAANRPQITTKDVGLGVRGAPSAGSAHARTRAVPQTDAANSLLSCAIVQDLADAVWERESTGTASGRTVNARDCRQFIEVLTAKKELLLGELSAPVAERAGQPARSFDRVLAAYLRAYASGDFVSRAGTNVSKPSVSGGISDDDIQGLTLVFFEAFYDCLYDMPVLYSVQQTLRTDYAPGQVRTASGRDALELGGISEPVTTGLVWANTPRFFAAGDAIPTAFAADLVSRERVKSVEGGGVLVTEDEARAIQRLSSLAGKQARALTGTLFGFLSNVNVSVVVGADFAIGDNETLLHAVEVIAEVTARRSSEYVSYRVARDYTANRGAGVRAAATDPGSADAQIESVLLGLSPAE